MLSVPPTSSSSLVKRLMLTRSQPRDALNDRRHFVEDTPGLKAIIGGAVDFATPLSQRSRQVAKTEHSRERGLAVAPAHAQDARSDLAMVLLVCGVDRADETLLPRPQLEQRPSQRPCGHRQSLNECDHLGCWRKSRPFPRMRPR